MTPAPKTLASEINSISANLLVEIRAKYEGKIPPEDYQVLIQSCTKLMEISSKIRTRELCHGSEK